jgi:hypothetical protein
MVGNPSVAVIVVVFVPDEAVDGSARAVECCKNSTDNTFRKKCEKGLQLLCSNIIIFAFALFKSCKN